MRHGPCPGAHRHRSNNPEVCMRIMGLSSCFALFLFGACGGDSTPETPDAGYLYAETQCAALATYADTSLQHPVAVYYTSDDSTYVTGLLNASATSPDQLQILL